MIQGICGRTYIESSAPPETQDSRLLFLWESKLRDRLATIGSTESALIWRQKKSPRGLLISRLAPSMRHSNGTGCTGSQWPTPKGSAAGPDFAKVDRSSTGLSLQTVMAATERWSTPRSTDGEKGAPRQEFSGGGQPLPAQMYGASMAPWVTPSARDWKDTPGMATEAGERRRIDQLPRQMSQKPQATWGTPTVHGNFNVKGMSPDSGDGLATQMRGAAWATMTAKPPGGTAEQFLARKQKAREKGASLGVSLTDLGMQMAETALTGPAPNGSSATTKKRGVPNPVFAFWLMGFPDEWISGALEAMRSFRKPRQKSSQRSLKRKPG